MNHDLPLGAIHVIGTDVGIKGAVVVVVDGKEVCMPVTMTFPDGHVVAVH